MKKDNKTGYADLYRKIKFIIIFRIFAFSIIILTYVLINLKDLIRHSYLVYFLTAFAIFATLVYSAALSYLDKKENAAYLSYFGYLQLFADIIVITAVVLLTGGLSGKFIFLYYIFILISAFVFLRPGVMLIGTASALALGLSADMQYYLALGNHAYFLANPDKLLFLTSINILGVLIFSWLLYNFSGELNILSKKIVEREEFIIRSQYFNRELFNSFSQGIIVLDADNSIIFINDAAVKMLGLNSVRGEFLAKAGIMHNFRIKIRDIILNFPPDILAGIESGTYNGNIKRFELNYKDMILGFSLTKMDGGKHKTGGYIMLFRDITYIKRLEIESKINEGLATAGKLAGWLAHEIRNPLAAINTSAYILNSGSVECNESDYRQLTGIIKTEVQRLDNLVKDFLGFVKVKSKNGGGASNIEEFNLFLFAEELISRFANSDKKYISGGVEISMRNNIDKRTEMFSEKSRLGQILVNILQNAIQSIERKSIKGGNETAGKTWTIRLGSKITENESGKKIILISIADNGEGMDDFTLRNAFKPLFTTKEDGFGLGLSIVHSITESLSGSIEAYSRANEGMLIKIGIPMTPFNPN